MLQESTSDKEWPFNVNLKARPEIGCCAVFQVPRISEIASRVNDDVDLPNIILHCFESRVYASLIADIKLFDEHLGSIVEGIDFGFCFGERVCAAAAQNQGFSACLRECNGCCLADARA